MAQETACEDGFITVDAPTAELQEQICTQSQAALSVLGSCGLSVDRPLTIKMSDTLAEGCLGLYHCGKDLIEIPTPEALADRLHPESIYQSLPEDVFFTSILAHELAHAVTDTMPCPFESCDLGQEYISYAMQFRSIPDDFRAPLIEDRFQRTISRDEIGLIIMMMAPDIFAQKTWVHFTQRDDPCGFVGQIADGTVLLDVEHF